MTSALDAPESAFTLEVDYVRGAQGHAVLAVGSDGAGAEALAVWSLGPTGRAGGAWVLRLDNLQQDVVRLQQIMAMIRGRCLVDWTTDSPLRTLGRLGDLLPGEVVAGLRDQILIIPEMLDEIAERRKMYADAVEAYRATTKSKIAPLVWPSPVPEPQTLVEWSSRSLQSAASPVAGQALTLTAAVARTAELWQDTEQLRYRRSYLRSFGEVQSLPPRWLARLRAANAIVEPTNA
jgi:hypothetical protein